MAENNKLETWIMKDGEKIEIGKIYLKIGTKTVEVTGVTISSVYSSQLENIPHLEKATYFCKRNDFLKVIQNGLKEYVNHNARVDISN